MKRQMLSATLALALAATLSGCAGTSDSVVTDDVSGYPSAPNVDFTNEPQWDYVTHSRVMVYRGADPGYDMFRYGPYYYVQRDGYWYRSDTYRGPFVTLRMNAVPRPILRVPPNRWHHRPAAGWRRAR